MHYRTAGRAIFIYLHGTRRKPRRLALKDIGIVSMVIGSRIYVQYVLVCVANARRINIYIASLSLYFIIIIK